MKREPSINLNHIYWDVGIEYFQEVIVRAMREAVHPTLDVIQREMCQIQMRQDAFFLLFRELGADSS